MAAVLGAALAALVGSSPLAGLSPRHLQGVAITLGLIGLALLGLTMLLVLRVMRPQSVSFAQVQEARQGNWPFANPLGAWRDLVESQEDLYLPCGVNSLTSLRQSMIIEEVTLQALARARGSAADEAASNMLCEAQTARAAPTTRTADRGGKDRGHRGVLQASDAKHMGDLRRSTKRTDRHRSNRCCLCMASALILCQQTPDNSRSGRRDVPVGGQGRRTSATSRDRQEQIARHLRRGTRPTTCPRRPGRRA